MIANSTQLSKRMFRSQRLLVVTILAGFITLLLITAIAGRHGDEIVKSVSSRVGLTDYIGSYSAAEADMDSDNEGSASEVTQQHADEQEEEDRTGKKPDSKGDETELSPEKDGEVVNAIIEEEEKAAEEEKEEEKEAEKLEEQGRQGIAL